MARFPKIDRPCPYKANLATIMDGDFCTMCSRSVVDLEAMTEGDRAIFLAACEEEVCVRYTLRPALVAAALAAAAMVPTAAAAQETPDPTIAAPDSTIPMDEDFDAIILGGINDPKKAVLVEDPRDETLPALPVVYEEEAPDSPPSR